ncbi:hypothetical protein [Infirmifilum sp.]|uniref:hypothetical protein n=1 Tax=Infirmifilum sp. TaxID=2856575 RepID=UPI003D122A2A
MSMSINERKTVIIGHFDTHGVTASALAVKAFNANEVYCNYPQTSPEQVVATLQNMYAASPSPLHIILVDIPIDIKNPQAFIRGLEDLASRHSVTLIDHHETSVQFLSQFSRVRTIFLGPSAYDLNAWLLSQVPNASDIDRILAVLGGIGDRDPVVVQRGLFTQELQTLADGLDVLVRERDGALKTVRALLQNPTGVLEEAKQRATQIPAARLSHRIGPVAVAIEALPAQWGPKSLEKMAFSAGAWYGVGWSYDQRSNQWIARAIIRWDMQSKMPSLPLPGSVARSLWPTRSLIGHPSAPSIAATSEDEAREMAEQWARALSDAAVRGVAPSVTTFISESKVGEMMTEILARLERILESQQQMYAEYLELKKRQVQLLERTTSQHARAD